MKHLLSLRLNVNPHIGEAPDEATALAVLANGAPRKIIAQALPKSA